jgi:hypothetical protein
MASIASTLQSLLPTLTSLSATGTTGMIISAVVVGLACLFGVILWVHANSVQKTENQTTPVQQQASTPVAAQTAQGSVTQAGQLTPPSDAGKQAR